MSFKVVRYRLRHYFRLLLVCSSLSIAVCTSVADTYGEKTHTVDNALFTAKVSIPRVLADNDKISGTGVFVTCTARAQNTQVASEDPITEVKLKHVLLKIGGETTLHDSYTVPFENFDLSDGDAFARQGTGYPDFPDIRDPRDPIFASTHFDDSTVVQIDLTLTFRVKRASGAASDVVMPVATIKPKAWNRVTLWRTTVNEYGLPLLPQYETWIANSKSKAVAAHLDAKYAVSIPDPSDEASIKTELATSTGIFALSHGGVDGVTDGEGIGNGHTLTWEEIKTALTNRYAVNATTPPMSHIFFYACKTIPGQDVSKFWLRREPLSLEEGFIQNSGSYGFDKNYPFCAEEADHIEELFNQFKLGTISHFALDRANFLHPIPELNGSKGSKAPLKIASVQDTYGTFKHCYLPPAARDALPGPYFLYADWWWAAAHTP